MPLLVGQVLQNRYHIATLLGQGGFGAVYQAWDVSLSKYVAIKENLDTSPEAQRQFQQEAILLAHLNHPNLPHVTDHFFVPQQGQYLVMDYVEGEDLQALLNRSVQPLPEALVLSWIDQVCDALTYLHSRTPPVIHRDIKPSNIRITPEGRALLVDFGISKVYDPSLKTTIGARAVTPPYSPPEQYGADITDARSDIYALGVTLYVLLTAQEPPESVTRIANSLAFMPPRQLQPAISPPVEAAILQACDVAKTQRFQSIDEFRQALMLRTPQGVVAKTQMARPPARSAGVPKWARIAGGIIMLLLLAGVLASSWSANTSITLTPTALITTAGTPAAVTPTDTVLPTSIPPTATTLPTAAASPATTPTRQPTATSLPVVTAMPACPAITGPFAAVWQGAQSSIGCGAGRAIKGQIVQEDFSGGKMFWREPIDIGQALVLFNNGTWRIFQHSPYPEGAPEFSCPAPDTPEQCPPTPRRGFGMMWCDIAAIRQGLGNAMTCEYSYSGAMQQFERGFMLQTDRGITYLFQADGTWEKR
jgi:eukaryotic-like serine/threonine-protein kinase